MALRKKVIFDCDNTMSLKDRDVDDGLALLYLLGRKDVDLAGVTATYGNSCIQDVYENTMAMLKSFNIKDIPVFKGAEKGQDRICEAAAYLARAAAEEPGKITLLATGSLSNLYGAYLLDNNFFNNLKQIVLMGGITAPLLINHVNLDELNFSCDAEAAYHVLNSNSDVTILSGNTCLQAFFQKNELDELKHKNENPVYSYIADNIEPWYDYNKRTFGIYGFYNWDIAAAVYLTNPELFDERYLNVKSTIEDLRKGYIKYQEEGSAKINIPGRITDVVEFKKVIFEAWAWK